MPRGSKPGEHRGGRKPGTPNKATRDIRELAQVHSAEAVKELAKLAGLVKGTKGAESEQARIAALKELLDRGHGKATQAVDLNVQQRDIEPCRTLSWSGSRRGESLTRANQTTKPN